MEDVKFSRQPSTMRKAKPQSAFSVPTELQRLLRRSGLSMAAVAEKLGYQGASSVQRYFSESDFRGDFLKLEMARRFTAVLEGLGDPPITEADLLALVDPKVRAMVRGRPVSVISYVQAGAWTDAADPYPKGGGFGEMAVDSPMGPHAFALEIRGDSMADRFREGDRVAIDPDVLPHPGDFVVAKEQREEEATFKQYRLRGFDTKNRPIIELRPLNDAWHTITLDAKNPGRIIGTMIEHHSYRRHRR